MEKQHVPKTFRLRRDGCRASVGHRHNDTHSSPFVKFPDDFVAKEVGIRWQDKLRVSRQPRTSEHRRKD